MPAKDDKQVKTEKATGKTAGAKGTAPPKVQAKKEGTRVSTMVDTRGTGGKKADDGKGSRDKPRDGSR